MQHVRAARLDLLHCLTMPRRSKTMAYGDAEDLLCPLYGISKDDFEELVCCPNDMFAEQAVTLGVTQPEHFDVLRIVRRKGFNSV